MRRKIKHAVTVATSLPWPYLQPNVVFVMVFVPSRRTNTHYQASSVGCDVTGMKEVSSADNDISTLVCVCLTLISVADASLGSTSFYPAIAQKLAPTHNQSYDRWAHCWGSPSVPTMMAWPWCLIHVWLHRDGLTDGLGSSHDITDTNLPVIKGSFFLTSSFVCGHRRTTACDRSPDWSTLNSTFSLFWTAAVCDKGPQLYLLVCLLRSLKVA